MKPTQEQVIAWAQEVGFKWSGEELSWEDVVCTDELQAAFTLAYEAGRKDENEACAKVCESIVGYFRKHKDDMPPDLFDPINAALECAAAIRARGEQ